MHTKKQRIYYFDRYSPITEIATIRALIALTSMVHIHQIDEKTIFLNGDLEEEIYMVQFQGSTIASQKNKVCKLKKSLWS